MNKLLITILTSMCIFGIISTSWSMERDALFPSDDTYKENINTNHNELSKSASPTTNSEVPPNTP